MQALKGTTKVKLLNGTVNTLDELFNAALNKTYTDNLSEKYSSEKYLNDNDLSVDTDYWVYSCNSLGEITPAKLNNIKRVLVNDIIKLTLDDESVIEVALDQNILLRNGAIKEINKLQDDDSLMPLNTNTHKGIDNTEQELIFDNYINKWLFTQNIVIEYKTGHSLKTQYRIKHINGNSLDNSPENLEWEFIEANSSNITYNYIQSLIKDTNTNNDININTNTDNDINVSTSASKIDTDVTANMNTTANANISYILENQTSENEISENEIVANEITENEIVEDEASAKKAFAKKVSAKKISENKNKKPKKKVSKNTAKKDSVEDVTKDSIKDEIEQELIIQEFTNKNIKNNESNESIKNTKSIKGDGDSIFIIDEDKLKADIMFELDKAITKVLDMQNTAKRNALLKLGKKILDLNLEINESNFIKVRGKSRVPKWENLLKYFSSIDEYINASKNFNHKIVKIKVVSYKKPVYMYACSVELMHNFAVVGNNNNSGIFMMC